jgi:hypothetical protein
MTRRRDRWKLKMRHPVPDLDHQEEKYRPIEGGGTKTGSVVVLS